MSAKESWREVFKDCPKTTALIEEVFRVAPDVNTARNYKAAHHWDEIVETLAEDINRCRPVEKELLLVAISSVDTWLYDYEVLTWSLHLSPVLQASYKILEAVSRDAATVFAAYKEMLRTARSILESLKDRAS